MSWGWRVGRYVPPRLPVARASDHIYQAHFGCRVEFHMNVTVVSLFSLESSVAGESHARLFLVGVHRVRAGFEGFAGVYSICWLFLWTIKFL